MSQDTAIAILVCVACVAAIGYAFCIVLPAIMHDPIKEVLERQRRLKDQLVAKWMADGCPKGEPIPQSDMDIYIALEKRRHAIRRSI